VKRRSVAYWVFLVGLWVIVAALVQTDIWRPGKWDTTTIVQAGIGAVLMVVGILLHLRRFNSEIRSGQGPLGR
jgi:hypothetical protein